MNFAYQKQILFALTFGALVYVGFQEHETSTVNYKRGLLAALLLFIIQGSLSPSQGSFMKRFEPLWRAASKIAVVYLLLLVFILYQTAHDSRQLLKHLDPELGEPLWWGSMSDSCRWTWRDVYDSLNTFYLRNLAGWFFTTLIVRDIHALYFCSFLIQFFDFSWEFLYTIIRTCWWQRVIVDMICAQTIGIILGMLVMKKVGLKEFDWFGRKGKEDMKNWDVFHNHRRFGDVCLLFIILAASFFCDNFTSSTLWIRHRYGMNNYRIIIWLLLKTLSIGELYDDVETWGNERRKSAHISTEYRWIVYGIIVFEVAMNWKFRHGASHYRDLEMTLYHSWPWNVICGIIIVTFVVYYLYLRLKRNRVTQYGDTPLEIEARNLDTFASSDLNPKKIKGKAKGAATFEQARNENKGGKPRQTKENKKAKSKKD